MFQHPRLYPVARTVAALPSLLLLSALFLPATPAQDQPVAMVNARIIPVAGPEIARGTLVVQGGRIVAVGPAEAVAIPAGAERRDLAGMVVMPGLVDTHTHAGGVQGADRSAPIQPGVRALDAIDVRASDFRRAVAGGQTTLHVMPGSGHLSSGQTITLKMRLTEDGPRTIDALIVRDAAGRPVSNLKMANGTNPRGEAPFPGTRGRAAFLVREHFVRAREYREKVRAAQGDASKLPPRDLDLETLAEVLDGTRVVHHHTHRHDDIMTVLRLKEEFGFRVVLHHVTEGQFVAREIARAGVPVSAILVDAPGGKLEAKNLAFENAGIMERTGVLVALHSDDPITDARLFLRMAALAVRGGMTREGALAAVTRAGAVILGLEDRIGTLEAGKDADFVILDGDPLSIYARVRETWVEGRKVFDLARPEDALYAEGGFGATHDVDPYFCCAHEAISQQLYGGTGGAQ